MLVKMLQVSIKARKETGRDSVNKSFSKLFIQEFVANMKDWKRDFKKRAFQVVPLIIISIFYCYYLQALDKLTTCNRLGLRNRI